MRASPLKKNEFLDLIVQEFLASHAPWRKVYENRRAYTVSVGRTVHRECFLWLSFDCRPDRYRFGHSVGWSPTEAAYLHRLGLRENPPTYLMDGSLRRIRTLEAPRDFESPEMDRTTFTLYRPYQDYSLETTPHDAVKTLILSEIEEYALPYLSMMLVARHGIEVTPEEIGMSMAVVV